jgi:SdpC family antimicrobial peptide
MKFLASVVAFTLLMAVFSHSSLAENSVKKGYTGEEIYRGVFLGEGEVGNLFPEIWDNYKSQFSGKEWSELKEAMVLALKESDPTFFDRFGEEMQSGDHLRIQSIIAESRSILKNSPQSKKILGKLIQDDSENATPKVRQDVYIYDQFVLVFKWLALWVETTVPNPSIETTNKLYQETLVDMVATRLEVKE